MLRGLGRVCEGLVRGAVRAAAGLGRGGRDAFDALFFAVTGHLLYEAHGHLEPGWLVVGLTARRRRRRVLLYDKLAGGLVEADVTDVFLVPVPFFGLHLLLLSDIQDAGEAPAWMREGVEREADCRHRYP